MLIGVSGYARAGKDTVGRLLVENHGFKRVSFALNPWIPIASRVELPTHSVAEMVDAPILAAPVKQEMRLRRLQEIVDDDGWERAKEVPEVRRILQRLGTEAGREVLGENVWVDAAFNGVSLDDDIVITDVRFPNEYDAIKTRDGEVWRVSRPGVTATNAHVSETAIDHKTFSVWLSNDGSIEDLAERVAAQVEISRRRKPVFRY
jgi:hypothetical protein